MSHSERPAADVTMDFFSTPDRRPHVRSHDRQVGSRARACQAGLVRLVLPARLYVAPRQEYCLFLDDVGFIDCRVASILGQQADGNDTRFHRRTFLNRRVPPAPSCAEGTTPAPRGMCGTASCRCPSSRMDGSSLESKLFQW